MKKSGVYFFNFDENISRFFCSFLLQTTHAIRPTHFVISTN